MTKVAIIAAVIAGVIVLLRMFRSRATSAAERREERKYPHSRLYGRRGGRIPPARVCDVCGDFRKRCRHDAQKAEYPEGMLGPRKKK